MRLLGRLLPAVLRFGIACAAAALVACGYSTGVSVRVLNADKVGADSVKVEALVDGQPLLCGASPCLNIVPALEPRPLQATEDVRVVLDPELTGKVVTIKVSVLKGGTSVGERTGMATVEKEFTKIVVVDFAPGG